jgi:DNA replication and repair protein RecF
MDTGAARNIIITGPNGSGKTAILEAVSMLSGDRGLRGAGLDDIARFGASGFSISAALADDTGISISWNKDDSNRRAKIDGDSAPLSALPAHLRMVWITPKEDRVFIESASDRRAFFDRLVSAFDPTHAGRVARLSKLLSERAFVLKTNSDENLLNVMDSQIAATSVSIACARIRYVSEINYFLDGAEISIQGMIENKSMAASDMESEYREYLANNRMLIADKMSIDGAHKSDFAAFSKQRGMNADMLSTGQQKSLLLDIILAHAKLIHAKTGKSPIILLDEAAAHLDDAARQKLFDDLSAANAQVWATGINAEIFAGIDDSQFVYLEK